MYLRDIGVSIVKFDDMPAHMPSIYVREAEHVVDILVYDVPSQLDHLKICAELSLWGNPIEINRKLHHKYQSVRVSIELNEFYFP